LKYDVSLRRPESVVAERGQTQSVSSAVDEIEPAVQRVHFVLGILQSRQAGTHKTRKLLGIGRLLSEDVSGTRETLKW
jgi:hypothetical protein